MIYFYFSSHWHTSRLTPQPSAWQRWWAQSGRSWFLFFFFILQHIFTLISLNPAAACPDMEASAELYERAWTNKSWNGWHCPGAVRGEIYISTCGTDPKPATRPVEKCGLLLRRKGVCYESMINATGVPFPFSTSPLWFCLATALKHWHKTVCHNIGVYLSRP